MKYTIADYQQRIKMHNERTQTRRIANRNEIILDSCNGWRGGVLYALKPMGWWSEDGKRFIADLAEPFIVTHYQSDALRVIPATGDYEWVYRYNPWWTSQEAQWVWNHILPYGWRADFVHATRWVNGQFVLWHRDHGSVLPNQKGMRFHPDGTLEGHNGPMSVQDVTKEKKAYVRQYLKRVRALVLPFEELRRGVADDHEYGCTAVRLYSDQVPFKMRCEAVRNMIESGEFNHGGYMAYLSVGMSRWKNSAPEQTYYKFATQFKRSVYQQSFKL